MNLMSYELKEELAMSFTFYICYVILKKLAKNVKNLYCTFKKQFLFYTIPIAKNKGGLT
jgi:hypothetical protein